MPPPGILETVMRKRPSDVEEIRRGNQNSSKAIYRNNGDDDQSIKRCTYKFISFSEKKKLGKHFNDFSREL